jgi:hypothetical protein
VYLTRGGEKKGLKPESGKMPPRGFNEAGTRLCPFSLPFHSPLPLPPPPSSFPSPPYPTSPTHLRCDNCSDVSFLCLMDHHNLIRNIFSRNTSPPINAQSYPEEQSPSAQHFQQYQHVSPAQSLKDVTRSSPTHVDSLFSNLTAPGQSSGNPNPLHQGSTQPTTTATTTSGPTSPASSITALSAPTNMSTSTNTPPNATLPSDSRQSALLSLLGTVSPTGSSSSGAPQQVPTPPGPPNRAGPVASNTNESQGRLLLEQLMAG